MASGDRENDRFPVDAVRIACRLARTAPLARAHSNVDSRSRGARCVLGSWFGLALRCSLPARGALAAVVNRRALESTGAARMPGARTAASMQAAPVAASMQAAPVAASMQAAPVAASMRAAPVV